MGDETRASPFELVMVHARTLADALEKHKGGMTDEDRKRVMETALGDWCRLCGGPAGCYCASCYDE